MHILFCKFYCFIWPLFFILYEMLIRLFIKTHFVLSFQYSIWIKNCSHGLRNCISWDYTIRFINKETRKSAKKKIKNIINIINDTCNKYPISIFAYKFLLTNSKNDWVAQKKESYKNNIYKISQRIYLISGNKEKQIGTFYFHQFLV